MSAAQPISDPVAAKVPSKDYPWWIPNIDHKITPEVRKFRPRLEVILTYSQVRHSLETYSGIRTDDIATHVYAIVS